MSKYLKDLITNELKSRLEGIDDALVVNVVGMEANANVELRRSLREKNMHLMVVKNSLATRATEGTALAPAFEGSAGTLAVVWGGEDVVSLAKEVVRLSKNEEYAPFAPKGGVMDGSKLSAEDVTAISKWPNRDEQLSLLVGQILAPGANLSSQLTGVGGQLASQISQKAEE
ncbi:MAG: 50S ribosomal protein L10 [Planctomycetes bacterium]|nr:50S ribosomal protein L10 [Planctomycetota bacterium]